MCLNVSYILWTTQAVGIDILFVPLDVSARTADMRAWLPARQGPTLFMIYIAILY